MNATDSLIFRLYATASELEWSVARAGLLARVCEALGAAGGAWITQGSDGVTGEVTVHPARLPLVPNAWSLPQFADARQTVAVQPLAGVGPGVALRHSHQDGGLTSTVMLWAAAGAKAPVLGDDQRRTVCHMVEAGAVALRIYVQRDEWLYQLGRANRGTAALVDSAGTIYAASPRFRELIGNSFSIEPAFNQLPFPLPEESLDGSGLFSQRDVRFRVVKVGSLWQLHARQAQPLDGLSPREQEIARALGNGKTFKSVAREKGIAVSTVANHASRIYRKLGIYRREDLVQLVRSPRGHERH